MTEEDYDELDDAEMGMLYNCPKCGHEYDEIDYEYQICHHCNWNANEQLPRVSVERFGAKPR